VRAFANEALRARSVAAAAVVGLAGLSLLVAGCGGGPGVSVAQVRSTATTATPAGSVFFTARSDGTVSATTKFRLGA
jgi:hypothetical protein